MKTEKQRKTVAFIEEDEDFIKQISKDVGCHYCKANNLTFSLNTFQATVPGQMGVFAWVHKEEKDYFWVATRKMWLDEARVASENTHFPAKTQDEDCVYFDARENYQDTVRMLKLLNKKH